MNAEFGPLLNLIGTWHGKTGQDISPEADGGIEFNPYYETIKFEKVGLIENAEEQQLYVLHYHQKVNRVGDDEDIHNETGYIMWEPSTQTISLSLLIPRGLALLAEGKVLANSEQSVKFEFKSSPDSDWGIVQSPFMKNKAQTKSFERTLVFTAETLTYSQLSVLEIYGKEFKHSEESTLQKLSD